MTIDGFRKVNFNAGEQGVIADFMAMQAQLQMMILEMFNVPRFTNATQDPTGGIVGIADPEQSDWVATDPVALPTDCAFCPFPSAAVIKPGGSARTLELASDGPLVQMFETANNFAPTEDDPALLVFWASRSTFSTLTTAVGDATNPRIDIVEMKLEAETGSPEDRVFSVESVRATLDMAGITTNIDTVIRAVIGGFGSNDITMQTAATGAGTGTLTRDGNAFLFEYQDGVTTVANFEAKIAALVDSDKLIEIESAGTGATLWQSPDDTSAAEHLTGGVDPLIASQSLNKNTRVKATFQIKAGTASATPAYPTPTAGFVAVAAVRVPATHNAVHSLDNFRDMRWPLGGVRAYDVSFNEIVLDAGGTTWTQSGSSMFASGPNAATGYALAICPIGGNMGRLVGVGVFGVGGVGFTSDVVKLVFQDAPAVTVIAEGTAIGDILGGVTTRYALMSAIHMMDNDQVNPAETRAAGTRVGTPFWTNGESAGPARGAAVDLISGLDPPIRKIGLRLYAEDDDTRICFVRFYIAHGIG